MFNVEVDSDDQVTITEERSTTNIQVAEYVGELIWDFDRRRGMTE
ncbi:MAG: hypothetical protein PHG80_11300 [Methanoregulaceae archaeon]|nr:hypothetical protein [Methanoregulaceae archaeon]